MPTNFDYNIAFSRNLGIISNGEQQQLQQSTVAIAGLGGAGGAHFHALSRLGVGGFHLADPDSFEMINFNRQWGSTIPNLGRGKTESVAELGRAINPELRLVLWPCGIDADNVSQFLKGATVVIDAIDFFAIGSHRLLISACRQRDLTCLLAAPIGFGAAVLMFPPNGPTFNDFFSIGPSMSAADQLIAFATGLGMSLSRDVDLSHVNLEDGGGPSVGSACQLAASLITTEFVKVLRCNFHSDAESPYGYYFDPLNQKTHSLQAVPDLYATTQGIALRESFHERCPALRNL